MSHAADARAASARADAAATQADSDALHAEAAAAEAHRTAEAETDPAQRAAKIELARQATQEASEKRAAATTARRAATTAANAVLDAELQDVSEQIAAAQSARKVAAETPNGIAIKTDSHGHIKVEGSAAHIITNNVMVRVVGAEKKVSQGCYLTFIGGMKTEICCASKNGDITWLDGKLIFGSNFNTFAGAKVDIVAGLKTDVTSGNKYSAHAGVKISRGPKESNKMPLRDRLRGAFTHTGTLLEEVVNIRKHSVGAMSIKASTMLEDLVKQTQLIGSATLKGAEMIEKVKTAAVQGTTFALNSSGEAHLRAGSDCLLEGGGSQVKLGGGSALFKGSGASLKFNGSGISSGDNVKLC